MVFSGLEMDCRRTFLVGPLNGCRNIRKRTARLTLLSAALHLRAEKAFALHVEMAGSTRSSALAYVDRLAFNYEGVTVEG